MPEPAGRYSRTSVALIAGRYELVRELGSEEEVVEWEGFDSALERAVVVRLLRPELVEDLAAAERFWQDARSAARSRTVSGQRVLDGGTDPESGRQFLVREWPATWPANDGDTATPGIPRAVGRFTCWIPLTAGRLTLLGLVVVAALGLAALKSGVEGWLAWINEPLGRVSSSFVLGPVAKPPAVGAQNVAATPTPAVPPPTVASVSGTIPTSSTAASAPRVTATPTTGSGVARRIVNTDGRGVALRASPGGDHLAGKGYDEGATVVAFEQSGQWTRIRGSDGREGWVLSVTLAP